MRRYRYALAAWLWLIAAASGQQAGQQLESIDVGSNATCPSTETLDRLVGGGAGAADLGLGFTFVTAITPEVFRGSPPASPNIDVRPALFAKVLLFGQSASGTNRILVAWQQGSEHKCGWMNGKDLLIRRNTRIDRDYALGPKPLLVSEVDKNERESLLTVKAIGANLDLPGNKGIQTFQTPTNGVVAQTLGLFEIFTVYDQARGIVPKDRLLDQYYLIGRSGPGEDQLYGWVNAQDVYLWNSRLAASWAGTGLGRGWLEDKMTGQPFMQEARDYVEPADGVPNNARYPIIGQQPSTADVQTAAAHLPESASALDYARLVKQYEMVVPGKACPRDQSDPSKCMSADEIATARNRLAEIATSLRRIDILFLIDGTISMDAYFPSTVQAVQSFVRQTLSMQARSDDTPVRVGAAVYGDYLGDQTSAGIFYRDLVKLQTPPQSGDSHWLDALGAYRPNPNGESDPVNKDKLEAPFAALVRAASTTPWGPNVGVRVIVHIADHGNREEGKTSGEPQSSLVETLSLGTVVQELKKRNIIYIPINVVGRPNETAERAIQARRAFLQQAAAIKAATFGDKTPVMRAYTTTQVEETLEQRMQAVLAALKSAVQIRDLAKTLDQLQETCARDPGGRSCADVNKLESAADAPTQIARELMNVKGLTKERVENIESRVQTVSYVWVRPIEKRGRSDVLTLNYYVALDKTGLDLIKGSVGCVCDQMNPGTALPGGIEDCLSKIYQGTSGQDVKLDQLIAMRRSLPVLEKNRALNINLRLLEQAIRTRNETVLASWRPAYCKADYLLGLVRGSHRIDSDKIRADAQTGQFTPMEAPKPYRWLVKIGRGEGLSYVPIGYLPQ